MGWKMPVVLSCMFCLMINCLSACFDRISALSAGCGCGTRPVRGTRNFGRQNILSGNRCKFTSMFICTSPAHPCASVASISNEIPSAPKQPLLYICISMKRQISINIHKIYHVFNTICGNCIPLKGIRIITTAIIHPG